MSQLPSEPSTRPSSVAPVLPPPEPLPEPRDGARRRRLVTVVLAPLVLAVLLATVGAPGPVWTALAAGVSVLVALTAATYVPDARRPWASRLGCTPCAGVAGGAALVALVVLATAPGDVGQAMLGAAIAGAGLLQRVRGAGEACPTRPAPRS